MSGAVRSAGAVSIPASVRKTIQNLKEIAGNHSDEEIYAMLKECSMDPNETAQKLLYQDPFHEVKRKRDKRKENVSNKDIVESRSRSGSQGRGGRGGRGNYPLRYISYDAGSGRGSNMSKENGGYQSVNRVNSDSANPPPATSQNSQTKTNVPGTSSLPTTSIGAPVIPNGNSSNVCTPQVQAQVGGWSAAPGNSTMADVLKSNGAQQVQTQLQSATPATSVIVPGQPMLSSQQYITSIISTSVSGVYSSSSDPVLVPSLDTRVSGAVGTIKREVGAQRLNVDQTTGSHDSKSALSNSLNSLQKTQSGISDAADSEAKVSAIENSATVHSFSHDRLVSKSQTVDGDHRLSEMQPQVTNSTSTASSVGRSSGMANHYNVRPQQFVGPQRAVGPNKEWKPKATNQIASTSPGIIGTSTVSTSASEVSRSPSPASNCVMIEDGAAKLHKKLEEMNVHDDQHVIMPNHLQVPEIERTGLSFGSFDASFVVNFGTSYGNDDESEKSSTPLSEESQGTEEAVEEPSSSTNTASVTPHEDYSHHPQESSTTVDDMPSTNDVAVPINPAVASQSDPTKAEVVGPPGPQYSLVQTAPNYPSIGLVTPIMGSQYPSYEHSEPQLRDASRFPNFVQPAYDPSTSFYTPLVRPSSDGDARFSPFLGSATATKYNGNLTILSGQNGPSSQESGNSLVLSNAGPTALATQTAGIVQTTIPMPQQTVPVFRQPTSVHIQHYPPNYIPYHPYISPMYVPSPTMHNFVGNSGFAQLPAGSSYTPAAAGSSYAPAAAGVKYSLPSQYKPGTASGNSPHIGVPAGYGSYTTAPSGYSASPTVTAGNVSVSDDIGGSHYKENNLYIAGQQAEGSGLWFPQQPRDLLGVQANSYYNMQQIPHSQHVTFAHTQGGHAAFSGLYHPTQSGPAPNAHPMLQQTQALGAAVGVVGAQPGVYQQPQRAQLSWPNNY